MDDLISRQAVLDIVLLDSGITSWQLEMINKLPSAEPEQKKGEWIRVTQGAIPEKYMCPFCHRTVEYEGIEHFVSIIYPFCHCGADMRGEEDAKRVIS